MKHVILFSFFTSLSCIDMSLSTVSVFTNLVRALAWINGTNLFIAGTADNYLYYYNMSSNSLLNSVGGISNQKILGLSTEPRSLVVFQDLQIAIGGGTNGDIYVWDYINSLLVTHTGIHTSRVNINIKIR